MLNEEQKLAVEHEYGPCFVSACPGAGKTTVIVERILRLINKGHSARKILCITFTNKAAKEMKERIIKKLGDDGQEVYITTFHALCATILRKYGAFLGYDTTTTILDDDDQQGLMAQCARQADYELSSLQIKCLIVKANNLRESLVCEKNFAENCKLEYEAAIITEYIERMRKAKQIDFSGLLSETIRLLESDNEVLCKLRHRFDFVQVDETQDTNYSQFKIVELIGAHNNVMLVGDADQSIYNWRGARYENIIDFIANTKAKVIPLPENFRSTPEIIKVADTLIRHNKSRQNAVEFRTRNPSGDAVECCCLPTPELEGVWIAHRIKDMIVKQGIKASDIAVLYRLNSMSRSIEQGLMNQGIPYQVIGGFSFYDRSEIKDCLAMLRFLVNKNDGTALCRFINKPASRLGDTTLGKIENFALSNSCDLVDALSRVDEIFVTITDKQNVFARCKMVSEIYKNNFANMLIGEILAKLVSDLNYRKFLESKFDEKELADKLQNIQELIESSALFGSRNNNDIAAYLNNIALQSSSDQETKDNSVSLMSLHSSKGLEFPVVFMPGVEDGQLPHSRAINERDGLEEERRLCYVGMTRAKKKLIVSYAGARMQQFKGGKINFVQTKPSRFLQESNLLEHVKIIRNQ